ncbi:TonB-dependent receptor [Thiocystis violacea]|uniref:TonB-dependent receptor n=1 Tax=Thiocystis violacea TaxID=13725 RepID=UPI001908862A|nr:TonB-dependent receptor [Thiocystis violacea]MBK1720757.1 hypothetical protein [Thiocystis violacea]
MTIARKRLDSRLGFVGWLGVAGMMLGQAPASGQDVLELKKVEVTGSHIKRTDLEGISPVVIIDRRAIDHSGANTVKELFRKVIYNTAGITDETYTQGFAPASAGIDLRGLGVSRTLVLVNGRRLPIFPFGQDGTSSFVDINLIPLGAVERVEILKDGASAIYGSDAVAGVVNIILRKDYEGAEISLDYGQTDKGDGAESHLVFNGGLSAPESYPTSNLTFTLDYLSRDEVWARDRAISESADGPIDDRSGSGSPGTILRASGPEPDPRCPANRQDGSTCAFDYAPYSTLIPEVERLGMALSGDVEIGGGVSAFVTGLYTHSSSERDLAATPGGVTVGADNPNNIFPGEEVDVRYRFVELGSRRDQFKTDFYNAVGGLRGMVKDWEWELAAGTGKVDTTIEGVNGYTTGDAIQAAVDSGALNVFGDSPDFNANTVEYRTKRRGESRIDLVDLKASGDVVELSAGALSAALGIEYRSEQFSDQWDGVSESGAVLGMGGTSGEGDRDVFASFIELSIPLVTDLELQLAGRYDDYSDFGDTLNPKAGLRWKAAPNLLLRASAGTGFKAPSLQELYSAEGVNGGYESVYDPMTGEVTEVVSLVGGNSDLEAEESENLNLGMVWDVTKDWDLSLDLWRLNNQNAVTSSPQFYVDNEAAFADNVTRDDSGAIVMISSPFQNVAAQKVWGLDLDTNVRWRAESIGDFRWRLATTYLGSFKEEPVSGAGFDELAGKDGRPRWRGLTSLWWQRGDIETGLTLNYTGDYLRRSADDRVSDWTTLDAQVNWTPPKLKGSTLSLGIDNLFDAEPPEDVYLEGWPFYNRSLHDARGRFIYARYKYTF